MRAGETAEAIAGDTGWSLDKVIRYAEPLLAERGYIAEQAQAVEVRRSGGGATLREAAIAAAGPDLEWDAFRREDGRWMVTAEYGDRTGQHRATWTYDHSGRNLHPQNDEARALMGARPAAVSGDAPLDDADIADALNLVAPIPVVRAEPEPSRPRLVAVPNADDDAEAEDADGDDGVVRTSAAHPTVVVPTPSEQAAPSRARRSSRATKAAKPAAQAPAADPDPEPDQPAEPTAPKAAPARKPKARKGRASVPTWDEILFGSGKPDDDA